MKVLAPHIETKVQFGWALALPLLTKSENYLCEYVSRYTCGHEDGTQLLQQTTLVHGLLTAGCSSRRVHWRHHDSHQLRTAAFCTELRKK